MVDNVLERLIQKGYTKHTWRESGALPIEEFWS